jgi:hypothetical protein
LWSRRRAIGKIPGGGGHTRRRERGGWRPSVGSPDQDDEEADGLGGLFMAEGDEVRLCQLLLLVVHTITGRLLLTKPVPSNPAFVSPDPDGGEPWDDFCCCRGRF